MKTIFYRYLGVIICIYFLYFSLFLPYVHAAPPKKILILPIQLHAEKDLTYLKQGIRDMLASRLNQENKLEIIFPPKKISAINEKDALMLGRKSKTDYAIYGSVTLFGESTSMDTRLLEIESGKTVIQFNRTGQNRNELIQHIDAFAQQIKSKILEQSTAVSPPPLSEKKGVIHQHIEQLPQKLSKRQISEKFKLEIRNLAIGDVTGDKHLEIIISDQNNILIFRPDEKEGLQEIKAIKEKRYNNFISLDVADINRNGKAEIFVTNLPYGSDRLQSFVLEYDGNTYVRIAKKKQLYFRTYVTPHGKIKIIAQKRGAVRFASETNPLFEGKVSTLVWQNGSYAEENKIPLPMRSYIYNFAKGDVFFSEKEMTIRYTDSNVLKVINNAGKEEWSSEDSFGSSSIYLELPDRQDKERVIRHYLPTPILSTDFNSDGKLDLLLIQNEESLRSINNLKLFKSGRVVCLSWDGLNFQPLWQSDAVSKYISDFAMADLMGNGQTEVIYAVVAKPKGTFQKGQSYIVRQPVPSLQ